MNKKIGINKHGECTASNKSECWRYYQRFFFPGCEYETDGMCANVHAIAEKKELESERQNTND